jgi:folate-dependent phosphoribosylglycinamide formyltransferase PurN
MIRVAILSNQDPVSNQLFDCMFSMDGVEVVGIGLTTTLTSKKSFAAGLYDIFCKTGFRYFAYQSIWHLAHRAKELLSRKYASLRNKSRSNNIPIMLSSDFNSAESLKELRRWKPDLIITRANQIFLHDLIEIAPLGMWCCHSSLLPQYRGIAAEFHALRRGEKETGFTIYQIDEELDAGDIIKQIRIPITGDDTVYSLTKKSIDCGRAALRSSVGGLLNGDIQRSVQSMEGASYFSWPKRKHMKQLKKVGRKHLNVTNILDMLFN